MDDARAWLVALALVPGASAASDCTTTEGATGACPAFRAGFGYVGETWRNSTGGLAVGSAYLDRLDLKVSYGGVPGSALERVETFLHVMYNNGHEISGRYVGDLQGVSNIESVDTWRAYEAWVQYRLGRDARHSVRFGLYDLNTEFDVLDSSALFVNSSHGVGPQISQTGLNGPSVFPITALGLRLRAAIGSEGYAQLVLLDGAPGSRTDPDETGFDISGAEGALLVVEAGGAAGPLSKLAIGAWGYTARFDRIEQRVDGGEPTRSRENRGAYAIAEGTLHEDGARRVDAFVRVGNAPQRLNVLDLYTGAGITARGLFASRPEDRFGLAVAIAHVGTRARQVAEALGTPLERTETALELTWRAEVNDWLTLQPDIQYVLDPGADPGLDDALVFNLRFEIGPEWPR